MQTDSTASQIFSGEAAKPGKGLELLFVISGWPIVYSLFGTGYTLAGDLSGFASLQAWAKAPKIAGGTVKGRPEEGGFTIGQMDIDLLDRAIGASAASSGGHILGQRYGLTDLLSRQSYLQGNTSGGHTTTLAADITPSATTITLADGTNFPTGGVCYIGQECILLGTKATNTYTGCTRGYRLTQATRHLGPASTVKWGFNMGAWFQPPLGPIFGAANAGVKVYDFLPSLIRRPAFLYKGFQSMTSTAQFLPAFGGLIISNPTKKGPTVTFSVMGTTWETYLAGNKRIAEMTTSFGGPMGLVLSATNQPIPGGAYGVILTAGEAGNWGTAFSNHYMGKLESGRWFGFFGSTVLTP